jgi:two-component SAPR family response regulator
VDVLQRALRVEVDGVLFKHGWQRALDLFLYLVHNPAGGTASGIAADLWGTEERRDLTIQKRFHSMVSGLRQTLGEEVIVRDSSGTPGRYSLNPAIELEYDLAKFASHADAILASGADSRQLPAVRQVLDLHADSYWPARTLRSPWFVTVGQHVEATMARLLERERELSVPSGEGDTF